MFDTLLLKEKIEKATKVLILLSSQASFDDTAASLALSLSLGKSGKGVQIISSTTATVELSDLVGADQIAKDMPVGNFIISIENALGSVEKVTHYLDRETLNLVLHPLQGGLPVDQTKIKFTQSPTSFDMICFFGPKDESILSKFIKDDQENYSPATIMSFSNETVFSDSDKYIQIGLGSATISEITAKVIKDLSLASDEDIAHNLFLGMSRHTNGFQVPPATSATFESAAWCLKLMPQAILERTQSSRQVIQEQIRESQDENPVQESPQEDWLKPPKILRSSQAPKT